MITSILFLACALLGLVVAALAAVGGKVLHEVPWHELEEHCRRKKRRDVFDSIHDGHDEAALGAQVMPGPHDGVEQSERTVEVRQLVDNLPEAKREVFHLVHELEMSVRDAADELGIPEGTAKSRLHYARKRLAREWQDLQATWEET